VRPSIPPESPRVRSQRGYLLLATAIASIAVMGAAGLAIDLGRMYVAKNETQAYTDAAAVAAAFELSGEQAGLQAARDAVAASTNRWNFTYSDFTNPVVEFSTAQDGPWEAGPADATGVRFTRVVAEVPVPMSFMRAVGSGPTRLVNAISVAGQVEKTTFREGLCPFSPFWHPPGGASREADADPDTGLSPGGIYTLRWGAGAAANQMNRMCDDDRYDEIIDIARAGGGDERGFIEDTSAAVIRETIVGDYQSITRTLGDSVNMTGGAKQTQQDALVERVRQDGDQTSNTYAQYYDTATHSYLNGGNGRRLIACPVNMGEPGGYQIIGIRTFFLRDEDEDLKAHGGNQPFCAEYVGDSYIESGHGTGAGGPGYFVVRLLPSD